MTAANWKTNEVQKPSLGPDVCVRGSNEVQKEGQSDRSALSRADAHKTNKNPVKEQLPLFQTSQTCSLTQFNKLFSYSVGDSVFLTMSFSPVYHVYDSVFQINRRKKGCYSWFEYYL